MVLGEDVRGALCCCGRCCVRVLLRDMQEQIIRGLKSANKGSKIWTPYSVCRGTFCQSWLFANRRVEIILGHDVRIKVVFDYECPLLEPRILTNPHMIQTGHIWFFQLAVCFWVLGLPLFLMIFQQPKIFNSWISAWFLNSKLRISAPFPGISVTKLDTGVPVIPVIPVTDPVGVRLR